jgi:predicted hydrocarbon binding protein
MLEQEKMATNMSIRAIIDSLNEILGENGAKVIFRKVGLTHLFDMLPKNDWEPCISVNEQSKMFTEVTNVIGLVGALGIWRRIGYLGFKNAVEIARVLYPISNNGLSPDEKFIKGIEIYREGTGKGTAVIDENGRPAFDVPECTICEGYSFDRPICASYEGVIQYLANWAYGEDVYTVKEKKCKAMGDDSCLFVLESK